MRDTESILQEATSAAATENYELALGLLERIKDRSNLPSRYYLLKARVIQLIDESPYSLTDAAAYLERAVTLEPVNHDALIDAGYFYARVVIDHEKAQILFRQALDLLRAKYGDALCGLAEALSKNPTKADDVIEADIRQLREYIASRM